MRFSSFTTCCVLTGSVVIAINRAVARATQLNGPRGAAEGLAALDALKGDAEFAAYQPYWTARAALLARTGNAQTATEAYRRANRPRIRSSSAPLPAG